eukprot:gene4449-20692_t
MLGNCVTAALSASLSPLFYAQNCLSPLHFPLREISASMRAVSKTLKAVETKISSNCSESIQKQDNQNEVSKEPPGSHESSLLTNRCVAQKSQEHFLKPITSTLPNHVRLKGTVENDLSPSTPNNCIESNCKDCCKRQSDVTCGSVNDNASNACDRKDSSLLNHHDSNKIDNESEVTRNCHRIVRQEETEPISGTGRNETESRQAVPRLAIKREIETQRTSEANNDENDLICINKTDEEIDRGNCGSKYSAQGLLTDETKITTIRTIISNKQEIGENSDSNCDLQTREEVNTSKADVMVQDSELHFDCSKASSPMIGSVVDKKLIVHEAIEKVEIDKKSYVKEELDDDSVCERKLPDSESLCSNSHISNENRAKASAWENPIEAETMDSDIIPKDEATKICDALLHALSPADVDSEPEEKYVVSIKLENLNKKTYRKRVCRSSTRLLTMLSKERLTNVCPKVEEKPDYMSECSEKELEPIAETEKTTTHRGRKCSKYQSLPKRTTRHSKSSNPTDVPEKLIVSINLENIDSYCEDEQQTDKPVCALSTYTYSEGWMIQNEVVETHGKMTFCVDDIYVDKEAFGVIKYRSLGDNGEVKEKVEILASKTAPPNYIWPPNESGIDGKEAPFAPCSNIEAVKDSTEDNDKSVKNEELELTCYDRVVEVAEETKDCEIEKETKQENSIGDVAESQNCEFDVSEGICKEESEVCPEVEKLDSTMATNVDTETESVPQEVTQEEPQEVTQEEPLKEPLKEPDEVTQEEALMQTQLQCEPEPQPQPTSRQVKIRKKRGKTHNKIDVLEDQTFLQRRTRSQSAKVSVSDDNGKDEIVNENVKEVDDSSDLTCTDKSLCSDSVVSEKMTTKNSICELETQLPEERQTYAGNKEPGSCDENMNETKILAKDVEVHIADVLKGCTNISLMKAENNESDAKDRDVAVACKKGVDAKKRRGGKSKKTRAQQNGDEGNANIKRKVLRPRRAASRLLREITEGVQAESANAVNDIEKVGLANSESSLAESPEACLSQVSVEDLQMSAQVDLSTLVDKSKESTTGLSSSKAESEDMNKDKEEFVKLTEVSPQLDETSIVEAGQPNEKENMESIEQRENEFETTLDNKQSLEAVEKDVMEDESLSLVLNVGEKETCTITIDDKVADKEDNLKKDSKIDSETEENCTSIGLDIDADRVDGKTDLGPFPEHSVPSYNEDLELNEETRPRVSTSIMSSIVTSLSNDLFDMNSCGLEFTLPGMSKDVLVKRDCLHGGIVRTNEIEDCLRLPPADACSSGDEMNEICQQEDLGCENGRINCEMQCRQRLVQGDPRLDCLSPYGDTSKFLIMDNDETNQCESDFGNVDRRIDKFEEKDTFFSENGTGSPFDDDEETEVDFKPENERQTDKWDQVIYNDDRPSHACLIDKSQLDPFINGDEIDSSGENPRETLLSDVEDFSANDVSDAQSQNSCDTKYDLPSGQFESVAMPTENFACSEELKELPHENVSYAKEASEGYSSGSSSEDEEDEDDSDSSESDTDSSSSSSSRSDDDDDDDDTDEESETSDSESDINEELKNGSSSAEEGKSDLSRLEEDYEKDAFVPIKIDEIMFEEGEILPIERKECREFFMGKLSKTPEKYLQIRKFIIKEWSKIRPAYLTKNSIRSKVDPTDANAVGRVFMFLENCGAINVGCSIKNKWVERMERRRSKYFNAKRAENSEIPTGEQKRKRGRPSQKDSILPKTTNHIQADEETFLDFNTITEEEKKANPQFFNGNKNKSPEKYLKMRNSIIYCWLDSKPAYLTKQAARMAMSWYCGDVNAISRVHDYLEQIGAINFGCAQEPRRGRPSRARMNQERCVTVPKDKDAERDGSVGTKAARMKSAQKKLEDISREVELEMGKPVAPCSIEDALIPFDNYSRGAKRSTDDILSIDEGDLLKPRSKRGRKPKIRQCEPDSTVHDENLLSEKELIRVPPRNGLIPVKDLISDRESGPASDKSSIGDSGFDSVSEISPLLESDIGLKVNGPSQYSTVANSEDDNDEQIYPIPTEERILDLSVITEEEKLGCPEFFIGSKVKPPEKYVKIRDSILKSWYDRKPFYLNKHNARCDMPWYTGDINSIGRVHAYLERVGAINYGAVQRPKRNGKTNVCRKRKLTDSPRYDFPSPETEDDDAVAERLLNDDMFNNDLITADEREAFKRFLTEGNGVDTSPSNYSKFRDLISDMWAKCKQKYLTKSDVERRYTDDGEDTNSDTGDDSYIDNRTIINGTYPQGGKNGVWDMTKTFSLGLRPRKRWKMDINQDWIDRTESEGFTIKHLSPDEERMESRARPLSFANKLKKSLPESDPYKLVPCRFFPSENAQPFTVTICLKALLVMDFHSHLSSSEVIGLVGGKYYHASRKLEIMRVSPCSNVGTNLQCEMDPVSQAKASSDLAQHGLDVVGWYHSHPTFAPTPSLRDIDTQSTFQEWFSRAGAPFVGIIISPYNMTSNEVPHKSQITCLTISDQWDESRSYRIPYMFKFKTEDLDKSDSFDDTREQLKETMQTVEGCKQYLCQGRLGNTPPGLLLLKSFEAKLNRKTSKKDEVLSQVRDLIGI